MMKKRFTDGPLEPATGKSIDAGTHIDDRSRFQMARLTVPAGRSCQFRL